MNTDQESPVCVIEECISGWLRHHSDPIDGIQIRADIVSGFFVTSEHVESITEVGDLDEYIYMILRKISIWM